MQRYAGMAELADAPDLGSGISDVQVQVLLPVPTERGAQRAPLSVGAVNWFRRIALYKRHAFVDSAEMASPFSLTAEGAGAEFKSPLFFGYG